MRPFLSEISTPAAKCTWKRARGLVAGGRERSSTMNTQRHKRALAAGRFLSCMAVLPVIISTGCADVGISVDPPLWNNSGVSTTTESHTDFATFELTRTVGWSSGDLAPGDILSATITHVGAGRYRLDLSLLESGDSYTTWAQLDGEWGDRIWDGAYDWDMYYPDDVGAVTTYELPSRELSAAEVQRMRGVFASVQVDHEQIDDMIDYYYWTDFRWDDRSLSANPTYGDSETIGGDSANAIIQMLEDFRSVSPASE
jgi:hypothetical protein